MADPATAGIGVGTVLAGTYEVVGLIGRGGMGSVWQAHHVRLPGKRVAIKVLHGEVAADAEALARFRREAEIATRLGHANIVEVHDFNNLPDGTAYLVLEYLDGEPLDARIRRGPMPLAEVEAVIRQIGAALAAAHREGIVHRDLKPQNVFLVPTETAGFVVDHVKVLDFGISKIRGSQTIKTQDTAILGTPQYMAPEQATGRHDEVDERTDVFALGAIAYEMLAGRPAFVGQTVPEVVFKVVYEEPPPLRQLAPAVPEPVAAAVHRALSKQREARFADVSEMIEALTGTPLTTMRRAAGAGAARAVVGPRDAASDPGIATDRTMAPSTDRGAHGLDPDAIATDRTMAPSTDRGAHGLDPDAIATDRTMAPPTGGSANAAIAADRTMAPAASTGSVISGAPAPADPSPASGATATSAATSVERPPRRPGVWVGIGGIAVAFAAVIAMVVLPGGDQPPSERTATTRAAEPALVGAATTADHGAGEPTADVAAVQPALAASADAGSGEAGDSSDAPEQAKPTEPTTGTPTANTPEPPAKRPPQPVKKPPADPVEPTPEPAPPPSSRGDATDPDEAPASGGPARATAADLERAEKALGSGQPDRAIHLARRALQRKPRPPAAYALLARAYCDKYDLGNARAAYANVPRRLQRAVKQHCSQRGIELD